MRTLIIFCTLSAGLNGAGITLQREDLQLTQPFGDYGGALAVGDFNGDGRPDLVVSTASGPAVMLNLGHAAFGPAVSTGISQSATPVVADFNHDGKLDLAAFNQIAFGRGDGTFDTPWPMSLAWLAGETADFNGDGLSDLAVIQTGSCGNGDPACSVLLVLLGNGDGTFRSAGRAQVAGAFKPLVADFNRDGKPDVAISLGNAIQIFLGKGDGTLNEGNPIPLPAGFFTATLLSGDLNGDGIPDLVSRYHVLLGLGDGTFRPPFPFNSSAGPNTAPCDAAGALADLDGDGRLDLATFQLSPDPRVTNRICIFPARGDGTFASPVEREVGWGPRALIAADFDSDGVRDLLVSNWRSNTISLLLTKPGSQSELRAVSAAEGTAVVAPGSLATLHFSLGVPAQAAPPPWPATLGGVTVRIDDGQSTRLAPLLYVSENQINFQVPPETIPSGTTDASISITRDGVVVQTGSIASVAPTLFMADPAWAMPVATNILIDEHGTQVSSSVSDCDLSGTCNFKPVSPSTRGSYLTFYATGFRGATTANVQCRISDRPMTVTYAGPQGTPGLDQINILLPDPSDDFWEPPYVNIYLSINGVQANMAVVTLVRYF